MTDPYRAPSTESCPACATPLLADDPDGVRRCPKGCGEWIAKAVGCRMWGAELYDADPGMAWKGGARTCVVCRATMQRHLTDAFVQHRCPSDHGAWFEGTGRAAFEKRNARALAAHRARVAAYDQAQSELDALADLMTKAHGGDAEATRALARRWLTLEHRLAALLGTAVIACSGGAGSGSALDNRAGGPRPASIVFITAGDHRLMEMGCWDPARAAIVGTDDDACRERITAAVADQAIVAGADRARYRLTGRLSDECEASGPTQVAAIAPETRGQGSGQPALAVLPPEVDLGYRALPPAFDVDRKPVAPPLSAEVRAAIAAAATADLARTELPRTIEPADLQLVQVVDLDLDGDRASDRLISATAAGGGYANYAWSGVVLLPGGDVGAARSLWFSDLEMLWFTGTFDLDGDGRRELAYAGEYYEGSGVGLARIDATGLVIIGAYGCGA